MRIVSAMNLLQWRKKSKLKMHQAAEVLDISQPTISRIERGDHMPNRETIAKLRTKTNGAITGVDLFKAWESANRIGAQ